MILLNNARTPFLVVHIVAIFVSVSCLPRHFGIESLIRNEENYAHKQTKHKSRYSVANFLDSASVSQPEIEWKRSKSDKRAICFTQRCHGLGDRLRRMLEFASYAWATGHDLRFDWGTCGGKSTFHLLFDDQNGYRVKDFGRLEVYKASSKMSLFSDSESHEMCAGEQYHVGEINGEDDLRPSDFYAHHMTFVNNKHCAKHLIRPEVVGLIGALQSGLRRQWRAMADHIIGQASADRFKVIGVHLRLGNGEHAFAEDQRVVHMSDEQVIGILEREAARLARERGWGERYRILVASDTPRILQKWSAQNPERVVVRREGCHIDAGQGILEPSDSEPDEDWCACTQGAAWADATSLGLADLLITPTWSELSLVPKTMILARGGEWCADAAVGAEENDARFGKNYSCVSRAGLKEGVGFPNVGQC
eukprot:TRINITY_DN14888_c0_g4_i1.p1 TRINITY_DN14888_c0_g4~~TRINITY_DN14888_c0_g4_i1.p1  ORF type:complete len:422 (+),score=49.96 TRINITY_DN14888_c0_g4_i1:152-1417(+)